MGRNAKAARVSVVRCGYGTGSLPKKPLSAADSIENVCFIIGCVIGNDAESRYQAKLPNAVVNMLRRTKSELELAAKSVRYDECRVAAGMMAARTAPHRVSRP